MVESRSIMMGRSCRGDGRPERSVGGGIANVVDECIRKRSPILMLAGLTRGAGGGSVWATTATRTWRWKEHVYDESGK
jgi:hypothetical protein